MKRWSVNPILATIAGLLATAALLAGDRPQPAQQVSAVELAEWIRDRRPNLRIIDLRSKPEFDLYSIPTAENQPVQVADGLLNGSAPEQVIVLYGDEASRAADALHRTKKKDNVYVLTDGLAGWLTDVMSPQLPPNATAQERAEYERKKAVAIYFGGQASAYGDRAPLPKSTLETLKRLKRRTC
jgi:rhodanese-related sulfurtransferase